MDMNETTSITSPVFANLNPLNKRNMPHAMLVYLCTPKTIESLGERSNSAGRTTGEAINVLPNTYTGIYHLTSFLSPRLLETCVIH
jgi:hypothetical protein